MERVRGCDGDGGGGTAKVWKQAGRCLSQPGHLKDDSTLSTGLLLAPHVKNMSVSTSSSDQWRQTSTMEQSSGGAGAWE